MTKIKRYANVVERFLHGEKGQRFFNFAYSIGAAIVIWGALFKILHLPGGSLLLCIGMGTEIAMFILTAFDRPPKEYAWEEVFPVLETRNEEDRPNFAGSRASGVVVNEEYQEEELLKDPEDKTNNVDSENISEEFTAIAEETQTAGFESGAMNAGSAGEGGVYMPYGSLSVVVAGLAREEGSVNVGVSGVSGQTVVGGGACVVGAPQQVIPSELTQQMQAIAEHMATLSETYTERMEDLNRNVGGLNTIYEIQLKSISSQLETIDRVNKGLKDIRDMYEKSANESNRYYEETEKMARYMRQLNAVYEKMITAMSINMQNPMMGGGTAPSPFNTEE